MQPQKRYTKSAKLVLSNRFKKMKFRYLPESGSVVVPVQDYNCYNISPKKDIGAVF